MTADPESPALANHLPMNKDEIWAAITAERAAQDEKWGEQNHEPTIWLAILTEEVGELSQAILADRFPNDDHGSHSESMQTEAIQLAALSVSFLEYLSRKEAEEKKESASSAIIKESMVSMISQMRSESIKK